MLTRCHLPNFGRTDPLVLREFSFLTIRSAECAQELDRRVDDKHDVN